MATTPNLHLPLLDPSQAQPHIPINAALTILDTAGGSSGVTVVDSATSPEVITHATELRFVGATVEEGSNGVAVITVGGGAPGGSNHDVQINSSGSFAGVSPGTAGHVLTSNGASADPSFQAAGGGGGAVASGTPLAVGVLWNSNSSNWPNTTFVTRIPGCRLVNVATSVKVTASVQSGTAVVGGAVLRRTLAGSTTYIDSTVITWGSSATPSLAAGDNDSDAISVTVDKDHDYYVLIYLDSNGLNGSVAVKYASTDTATGLLGNTQAGDTRANATAPGTSTNMFCGALFAA